jgi:hypothetical protein
VVKKSLAIGVLAVAVVLFTGLAANANSLTVNAAAAMGGSVGSNCGGSPCGLQVNVSDGDNTQAYVETDEPNAEKHYDLTFWLNPGGMTMSPVAGQNHFIFGKLYRTMQPSAQHTFIYLKRNNAGTAYRLAVLTRKNNGQFIFCGEFFLGNSPTPPDRQIRVEWQAATAPAAMDGYCKVYRDGSATPIVQATGIDNDTYQVDYARFGLPPGADVDAGSFGHFFFDEFVSVR